MKKGCEERTPDFACAVEVVTGAGAFCHVYHDGGGLVGPLLPVGDKLGAGGDGGG